MKDKLLNAMVILIYLVIVVAILVGAFALIYAIATSDLPDWVKFALLK